MDLKSNIVEKLPQCKRVAEQLGEIAGVSSKTIYNTETILTKGTKEDIGVSITSVGSAVPPVGVLYVYMDKCKRMRVKPLKIDFRGILYKGYIINAQ